RQRSTGWKNEIDLTVVISSCTRVHRFPKIQRRTAKSSKSQHGASPGGPPTATPSCELSQVSTRSGLYQGKRGMYIRTEHEFFNTNSPAVRRAIHCLRTRGR